MTRRRLVVQMAGSPGSGKSTLARMLGRELPALVLDKDVVKSALLVSGLEEATAAPAAYEVFFAVAGSLLCQGHSVVLDSPSYYASIPATGLDLAARHGADYVFVECSCPVDVVRRRIDTRTPMRSQGGRATDRPSVRPAAGTVVVVDTSRPAEEAARHVLRAIGADGAESVR